MREIKDSHDFVWIQQSRQWWKTAPSHITKGNDIFLSGVASFISKFPEKKIAIVLFEYGADVEASKKLIEELGIASHVHWMPTVLRKEMLALLSMADLGIGQFGSESWYLYCSNAEILATGIGYIGYRDDAFYLKKGMTLYPMFNCNSADEICDAFETYIHDKAHQQALAEEAQLWLREYNEKKFLENIEEIIADTKSSNLPMNALLRLRWMRLKMEVVALINRLVLLSRSEFLRKKVLEWPVS
jgi:hypothetical protein